MSWEKQSGGTSNSLSPATTTQLGGIKIGNGLNVTQDGTVSVSITTTPIAEQITEVELIPPQLNYSVDTNSGIHILPLPNQIINIQYLNKIVSYPLPAIVITTSRSLFLNPSDGTFTTGFGNPINQIVLLTNKMYSSGVTNYDNVYQGALVKYIDFASTKFIPTYVPKDYTAIATSMDIQSLCFIGDNLWAFDKDINTSNLFIYNPITLQKLQTIPHSLGYWNSADYNKELDCIVGGNGTGSGQYTDNKATVYYNVSTWTTLSKLDTTTVKYIDIDLNGLNATGNNDFKVQACWGDNNFGEHNIIYIVTNDGRNIRKLMLGKGVNNLGSGNMNTVSDNEFNGTYKILDEWIQVDGGGHFQDMVYYNGAIYNGSKDNMTEGGLLIWKNELCKNGIVNRKKIFIPIYDNTTGSLATNLQSNEGLTIKDNQIYTTIVDTYYFIIDVPI